MVQKRYQTGYLQGGKHEDRAENCGKIMKSMGGSVEVMNDGQYFIIQLVFLKLSMHNVY